MTTFLKRANSKRTDIAIVLFALSLLLKIAIFYLLVDVASYIDIQELYIAPTVEGQPIEMYVKRVIHKNFDGGYRVDIRTEDNTSFCATGDISLSYREDAPLASPVTLDYWAGGGSCTGRIPQELKVGKYVINTCHYVKNPWYIFTIKEKCYGNLILEILPKETIKE